MSFKKTRLWQDAFEGEQATNEHALLKQQLLGMREKVAQLVAHIPADCKGLTIHDVTHLDALWEAADLVSGEDWKLNPAEAFVFGAAVLIHDAGLTTLSYENGKEGLRDTVQWRDAAADLQDGENDDAVLFEVLRNLHAEQASRLCSREWASPVSGQIYLIEDSELREAFGEIVGRVAHSHHWDASRVQEELQKEIGGSHKLPPQWTINERKLACLIRCADAAQVDRTRAPLMSYAALGPSGYSDLHWRAQAKLNRLTRDKDAVNFTSSSPFSNQEANAWWVAYDLALVLDKELKSSNAILGDMGEQLFAAGRVSGVTTPSDFSQRVRTESWRPIDASVRISDPLLIAKTLGGRNLYGMVQDIPFRELIQNSVDAIRAKRALVGAGREVGQVSITIDHHASDEDCAIIQIEDDGIGMSEVVLSTALVDFGKSFWNSDLLKREFPGLKARKVKSIGRYGIGFFSVFELTERVKVASRRYDKGLDDAKVLDFRGLSSRPLLMKATQDELPYGISTRTTLIVKRSDLDKPEREEADSDLERRLRFARRESLSVSDELWKRLRCMCAFLDVAVSFQDNRNGTTFTHSPDVYNSKPQKLIEDLQISENRATQGYFDLPTSLKPIRTRSGDAFGIAALDILSLTKGESPVLGLVSVGGIISAERSHVLKSESGVDVPYIGIAEAKAERAARDLSSIIATQEAIDIWLEEQVRSIDTSRLRNSDLMTIASFYYNATGRDSNLPFSFNQEKLRTVSEVSSYVDNHDVLYFPANLQFDKYVDILGYSDLRSEFFEARPVDELFVTGKGSRHILGDDEEEIRTLKSLGTVEVPIRRLRSAWPTGTSIIGLLKDRWDGQFEAKISKESIFATKIPSLSEGRWVLILKRS